MLLLVYSNGSEATLNAMRVMAIMTRKNVPPGIRRQLLVAGAMFPTCKLGLHGEAGAELAAAEIASNFCEDLDNLDDMMSGSDFLQLCIHFVRSVPADGRQPSQSANSGARSGQREVIWGHGGYGSTPEGAARRAILFFGLKTLCAICAQEKNHARFLQAEGLQLWIFLSHEHSKDAQVRCTHVCTCDFIRKLFPRAQEGCAGRMSTRTNITCDRVYRV